MKKLLLSASLLAAFCVMGPALKAQVTSSGSLTVTATIDPSISLTFSTDASGVTLTGSGTNAATLPFGEIKAYGTNPTNVTQTVDHPGAAATSFTVSTPIDVLVMVANSTSANYTLTAALNAVDSNTDVWKFGTTTLSTDAAPVTTTGAYNTAVPYTVSIQVPFTNTSGSISNAINFVATAN